MQTPTQEYSLNDSEIAWLSEIVTHQNYPKLCLVLQNMQAHKNTIQEHAHQQHFVAGYDAGYAAYKTNMVQLVIDAQAEVQSQEFKIGEDPDLINEQQPKKSDEKKIIRKR